MIPFPLIWRRLWRIQMKAKADDRLSFMRFLALGLSDRVPDAKTVWLFRERLTQSGAIEGLFNRFDAPLRNAGYLPMSGQAVFLKTGRTSRQSRRTRIVMHDGH